MPDLQAILEHSEGDSYEQYLAHITWHRAISSRAYLLYSSNDPLEAAICAGKAIQKSRSLQPHHLRAGFDVLMEHLDQFVANLVDHSSSEKEIGELLWNKVGDNNNYRNARVGVLPKRLLDFLDLDYKQVNETHILPLAVSRVSTCITQEIFGNEGGFKVVGTLDNTLFYQILDYTLEK